MMARKRPRKVMDPLKARHLTDQIQGAFAEMPPAVADIMRLFALSLEDFEAAGIDFDTAGRVAEILSIKAVEWKGRA